MNLAERLASDLSPLNNLSSKEATGLGAKCLEFILEPSKADDFQVFLGKFAEHVSSISPSDLKSSVKSLLILFQSGIKDGCSSAQMEMNCSNVGLNTTVASSLGAVWQDRYKNITDLILEKTLSSNTIVDMDWNFGVTASSNDCDQVGKTFLQLKLSVNTREDGVKDIFMELTLEQFYQFLAQMEKCKSYLDLLTMK